MIVEPKPKDRIADLMPNIYIRNLTPFNLPFALYSGLA